MQPCIRSSIIHAVELGYNNWQKYPCMQPACHWMRRCQIVATDEIYISMACITCMMQLPPGRAPSKLDLDLDLKRLYIMFNPMFTYRYVV